ncbi:MAG: ABC transporter ATP-binding protein [Chloroflexi bacterium]|jgi:ABC-2 type transport system ATP-binding protein|nr:ABC transporter ATP-binding protein [Chloroflexota bacterium]
MNNKIPAVTARGLTKYFGDFTAVNGIDFDVYRGEIFGFLGPNGSGKTTTIRMMLGLLQPSAGSISVLGLDAHGEAARIRPRVGYMSQRFSLYNDLTVIQNLKFYGAAYGLNENLLPERIQEALAMAGLEGREHAKTKDLSGGWRQRLALSAAILHRPEVLFLDEPTAGVDPISRRAFWDLLYKLVTTPTNEEAQRGVTVFVTTHYMDEAEHCHRLAFIQRGEMIAYGSPKDIKHQKMNGQVLEIAPSNAVTAVKVLRDARNSGQLPLDEVELYGALVHVVAPGVEHLQSRITTELRQASIHIEQMEIIEPSLEDVFIACMR